jgi:hypothetical protein
LRGPIRGGKKGTSAFEKDVSCISGSGTSGGSPSRACFKVPATPPKCANPSSSHSADHVGCPLSAIRTLSGSACGFDPPPETEPAAVDPARVLPEAVARSGTKPASRQFWLREWAGGWGGNVGEPAGFSAGCPESGRSDLKRVGPAPPLGHPPSSPGVSFKTSISL